MREAALLARSPIAPAAPEAAVAGWAVSGRRSAAALTLTDCTPLAKVMLKAAVGGGSARTLGVPFGRAARQSWNLRRRRQNALVVGAGPGEWLVIAPPGTQDGVVGRLTRAGGRDGLETVVDLTHGRALVRLAGERSAGLLAKETAVDLSDQVCPDGAAFRSALAGLSTDVVRDDRNGTRSYLVHCERSSGQYLFDVLLDAGQEFGVEVNGFELPGI